MVKDIITDRKALTVPCVPVEEGDMIGDINADLIDTAQFQAANGSAGCGGLAANQIGYDKRIFVVMINGQWIPFINPKIVKRIGKAKSALEGCLSLPGHKRKVSRFPRIRLEFNDFRNGARVQFNFKGLTARAIQHELDHLDGVLI